MFDIIVFYYKGDIYMSFFYENLNCAMSSKTIYILSGHYD